MNTPLLPRSVGWHGKLPARGDFVGRGLPRPWLRQWDDWLQRSLTLADQRWGSALRQHLQDMPPWQGIVRPADQSTAMCVVVVASTDRVGRAWPLVLAEAHDADAVRGEPLAAWRARALDHARWLESAAPQASPKEMDAAVARIAATPWPVVSTTTPQLASIADRWPDAASFWWRAEPDADMLAPRVQDWPPRETLLLDWLGEDDTTPG